MKLTKLEKGCYLAETKSGIFRIENKDKWTIYLALENGGNKKLINVSSLNEAKLLISNL